MSLIQSINSGSPNPLSSSALHSIDFSALKKKGEELGQVDFQQEKKQFLKTISESEAKYLESEQRMQQLEAEIKQLQANAFKLESIERSQKSELEELRKQIKLQSTQIETLEAEAAEDKIHHEHLSQQVQILKQLNSELKTKLQAEQSNLNSLMEANQQKTK
jgi:septal ring factor EnvC (AmiA/AmiB activator)